jgi:hypothetical protein
MAKTTRIAKCDYKHLKDVLFLAKFKSSSKLARLLLEAWAFEDGHINSEWWIKEKVCVKGDFSKLRSRLIKENFIVFREDTKRYLPGVRLKPYLERFEENRNATLADLAKIHLSLENLNANKADKKDLKMMANDVQDLKSQMHEIREILAELTRLQAPPPSLEAQKKSAELTEKLGMMLSRPDLQ